MQERDIAMTAQAPLSTPQPIPSDVQAAATTSLILEIIFGFFGLLGIGHVYSGRTPLGIALMAGWWVYLIIAGIVSSVTAGLGACLFIPIYLAVPILSGIQASAYAKRAQSTGSWESVAVAGGIGCLAVVTVCLLSIFALGGLAFLSSLLQSQ